LRKVPAGAWMDPAEVTAWIAFRKPFPRSKWDEFANGKLSRSWPEWGFRNGIVTMEDQARLLLSAFLARGQRRPWRVPNAELLGGGWIKSFREQVSRLMRQHAASATTLAAELEQDIKTHTAVYTALDSAQQEMIAAVREERLELFGHKAKGAGQADPSAVAVRVEAVLFLGPRTIDLDGWIREDRQLPTEEWAGYRGPYYDRVRFKTEEVIALWPVPKLNEAVAHHIASETRLIRWLTELMRTSPNEPMSKADTKLAAIKAGFEFPERAFQRAWAAAVRDSEATRWATAGRKSKRRIDTPT
jgi:hypothetical protein